MMRLDYQRKSDFELVSILKHHFIPYDLEYKTLLFGDLRQDWAL